MMVKVAELQKIIGNEQAKVSGYMKKNPVNMQSSEKNKEKILKMAYSILNSQNRLSLIQAEKKLYKSIYIAVNIRLKELINMDRR